MLQVIVDSEFFDPALIGRVGTYAYDIISIGHDAAHDAACVITFVTVDEAKNASYHAICTDSVFFKGFLA